MSEEIDKHVLSKYEIQKKLGKGVRTVGTIKFSAELCRSFNSNVHRIHGFSFMLWVAESLSKFGQGRYLVGD